MSAVDPHVEAHRLKRELGWGARRIAAELGVSRYAAEQLLKRPLAEPVAEVAAGERPLAEPPGDPAAAALPPAGVVADGLDTRPPGPWLRLNLSQRPRLWRALATLLQLGMRAPVAVDVAVRAFARAYHQAVIRGELVPGQPYEVQTRIRPATPATAGRAA
ncbi:hypothetical protein [Streptomyces sp. TRM68416]|uniref:hypothetical protein n=1 Tax=Streptomyces sp. TRM68416 TaxID=2758412 RepID=UPI001661FD19|nr:hypothetical protein [Streptomyces sp. TRM68416]MBD0837394.1 hypothetical protein [Streptomyces sp. TRM68416]